MRKCLRCDTEMIEDLELLAICEIKNKKEFKIDIQIYKLKKCEVN